MKVVTISSRFFIPLPSLITSKASSITRAFLVYWANKRCFSLFLFVIFLSLIFRISIGLSNFCLLPSALPLSRSSSLVGSVSSGSYNRSCSFFTSNSNCSFPSSLFALRERIQLLCSVVVLLAAMLSWFAPRLWSLSLAISSYITLIPSFAKRISFRIMSISTLSLLLSPIVLLRRTSSFWMWWWSDMRYTCFRCSSVSSGILILIFAWISSSVFIC